MSAAAREASLAWQDAASSADGTRLAAVASSAQIFISGDGGATWSTRGSSYAWNAVAVSADRTKQAATGITLQIFVVAGALSSKPVCAVCIAASASTGVSDALKTARMMSAPGSCELGAASVPLPLSTAVYSAAWAGWGPSLRSIDLRASPVTSIPANAFAVPGAAAVTTITNLTAAGEGGISLVDSSFAGLSSLRSINSRVPGVIDLAGLGVRAGAPGTWDWDILSSISTAAVVAISLVNNSISTFVPLANTSTLTFPSASSVLVCGGNPGASAAFRTGRAFSAFPNARAFSSQAGLIADSSRLNLRGCGIDTVHPAAFALPWSPGILVIDLT